ncbi:MAG TPA: cupin domain-containing protein [Opitutus sp.]|nr:cupin domain-containing protein [Opitutus sp.]
MIKRLGLVPLPVEGGFFRRTWTGPAQPPAGRSTGTAIYFLVTDTDFSALHRLITDEVWCFHAGDPVEHVQLSPGEPAPRVTRLGGDLAGGQVPQLVVPGGVWQGARLAPGAALGWGLLTCFMAPGWVDGEFALGDRAVLCREFPVAAEWIEALTR